MSTGDVLYLGGTILTMAPGDTAEAVLVRDGHIVHAGSEADCRAMATDPGTVDLEGGALLPGFIDAHCHPLMYGQFQTWSDCSWESAPDIDSVVQRLRKAGTVTPGSAPIRGRGFNQGNVAEHRHLHRNDLDRVDTGREVMVFHSSGHGAYVNGWTLDDRGLHDGVPDPEGGHFGRDENGELDGSMWDAACDHLTGQDGVKVGNHGPNFHVSGTIDEQVEQLRLAEDHFLRSGVTSVVDAQVTSRELRTYFRLRDREGMRMRVDMLILSSLLDELAALGIGGRLGDDRLAIAGVKLYADGSLTSGTARFAQPYCCDPADHGFYYHDNPDEFISLLTRAHELGLQTGTHAQGDAAIDLALRAIESAQAASPRHDPRHRIEHCGGPTPEQVTRIAELDVFPITQPQYIYRYGDELVRALGRERADRIIPLAEFEANGVPLVLSSDAPVAPPQPLEAVWAAVRRRTLEGDQLGTEDQKVTVRAALAAHTIGAARSIRRENERGSIESGKAADFVLLDGSPLDVEPDRILDISVLETWVGGTPMLRQRVR